MRFVYFWRPLKAVLVVIASMWGTAALAQVDTALSLYTISKEVGSCVMQYNTDLEGCKSTCSECTSFGGCAAEACTDTCMKKKYPTWGIHTNPATFCQGLIQAARGEVDPCDGATSSLCEGQGDMGSGNQNSSDTAANIPQTPRQQTVKTTDVPIPQHRPENPDTTTDQEEAQRRQPQQGGDSGATSTASWSQEASQDIQRCSALQSTANTCCHNPTSCSGSLTDSQKASYAALVNQAQQAQRSGDSAGLQEICQRSKSMNINSGNVNTGFANVCYSKHSMCTQTCSSALTKWQQRLNSCGAGCDRSVVSNAVNALLQRQNQCQSYAQLESQIRAQAYSAANDTALSSICQTGTLSSTDSNATDGKGGGGMWDKLGQGLSAGTAALGALGGGTPNESPTHEIGSPDEEYCSLNPNAPSCYVAPQFIGGESSSVAQADGNEALSEEDFNVGDNIDGNSGKFYSAGSGIEPTPVQGHAITNGGAGGIPGDSGSSQALASNNSEEGQNLPAMLGSGVNPNILHGEGGGGGYSNPVGSSSTGSGFNFKKSSAGFKPLQKGRAGNYKGLDLKKYLPGGSGRRGLAGLSAFHPDIGPKHVSFFTRVSARMRTLCHLKKLLDCQ